MALFLFQGEAFAPREERKDEKHLSLPELEKFSIALKIIAQNYASVPKDKELEFAFKSLWNGTFKGDKNKDSKEPDLPIFGYTHYIADKEFSRVYLDDKTRDIISKLTNLVKETFDSIAKEISMSTINVESYASAAKPYLPGTKIASESKIVSREVSIEVTQPPQQNQIPLEVVNSPLFSYLAAILADVKPTFTKVRLEEIHELPEPPMGEAQAEELAGKQPEYASQLQETRSVQPESVKAAEKQVELKEMVKNVQPKEQIVVEENELAKTEERPPTKVQTSSELAKIGDELGKRVNEPPPPGKYNELLAAIEKLRADLNKRPNTEEKEVG